MPFLVRKLVNGTAWSRLKLQSPAMNSDALPGWVYGEFAPRPADQGWLSCFVAESMNPEDLVRIAGAMSLFMGVQEGKQRQHFVGIERSELEKSGFAVRKSPGGTYNIGVDNIHEEIEVSDIQSLAKLTALFWNTAEAELKGTKIGDARMADAQADQIRFSEAIVDKKLSHEEIAVHYVREKHMCIRPC